MKKKGSLTFRTAFALLVLLGLPIPATASTTLPFAGSVNSPLIAWSIAQDGTGGAGRFWGTPTSTGIALEARNDGSGPALYGWSLGSGVAGIFEVFNAQSTAEVLRILNGGLGKGISVATTSITNASPGVEVIQAGAGVALNARTSGGGRAALFELTQIGNASPAVDIANGGTGRGLLIRQQNTGNSAPALEVASAGTGAGILVQSGTGSAGRFIGQGNATNAVVWSVGSGNAPAVHGIASNLGTGTAATFESFNPTNTAPAVSVSTSANGPAMQVNHAGPGGALALFRVNGVNQIRLSRFGRGFFNGGTQTGGADVAEAFEVEGEADMYEPGDVLEISTRSDRRVTKSGDAYSTLVIGVYATKPGVLLTELSIDDSLEGMVPVGVVGVIPTKVTAENGAIHRGDLLVSAGTPGHAMRADPRQLQFGMVLGKALEEFAGPGRGIIRVLVNVK